MEQKSYFKALILIIIGLQLNFSANAQESIEEKYYAFNERNWLAEIPLWIPANETELLKSVSNYAPTVGIQGYKAAQPDMMLREKDLIKFGTEKLEILYAPGHSEGHLMFYHATDQLLIAGDVIFRESIGRTDLPGGDFKILENVCTVEQTQKNRKTKRK